MIHIRSQRSIKTFVINLLVFIIATVFLLSAIELYLRLTIPESSKEPIFEWSLDTKRFKEMKQNTVIQVHGVELRTNSLGFRDNKSEIPLKTPGEFRIIVLGDSFTVSGGVEFDAIYTSLSEVSLQQLFPETKIINLGVAGYNVVEYSLVLDEIGMELAPDFVLVSVFLGNDFNRGAKETHDLNYRRAAFGIDLPKSPSGFKSLYVYRAYLWRVEEKLTGWFEWKDPADSKTDSGARWTDNLAALSAISKACLKKGIPMAVAILPDTWNLIEQQTKSRRVIAYLEGHNISYIDLLEPLIARKVEESSLRLNVMDSHPNAEYHRLITTYLAPFLSERISPVDKSAL